MAKSAVLTPLGVAALSLLSERPMHPYEMYQLLMQRSEDRLVKVRPGTLYHTVGRLDDDGLVEAGGTEREGNRPERTTYSISEAGRTALHDRLKDLIAVPVNEYPSFPLAIAEAHNLPADVVLELLDQRLASLAGEWDFLAGTIEAVSAKKLETKYWIDLKYQQSMLGTEIDWITQLRADIATGSLEW